MSTDTCCRCAAPVDTDHDHDSLYVADGACVCVNCRTYDDQDAIDATVLAEIEDAIARADQTSRIVKLFGPKPFITTMKEAA